MNGNERRNEIMRILQCSQKAISGGELARTLGVSRQIIVQDIALLRTSCPILATAQGYLIYPQVTNRVRRAFTVRHTRDQVADELYTIVDLGGKVLNVAVEHDVYGQITMDLIIATRKDVDDFCLRLASSKSGPLLSVADGTHIHTVEADSDVILDKISAALTEKSYLRK